MQNIPGCDEMSKYRRLDFILPTLVLIGVLIMVLGWCMAFGSDMTGASLTNLQIVSIRIMVEFVPFIIGTFGFGMAMICNRKMTRNRWKITIIGAIIDVVFGLVGILLVTFSGLSSGYSVI